jgi:RNA polymerase sigma factor FliA
MISPIINRRDYIDKEKELWKEYYITRSDRIRDILINRNYPLIIFIAKRFNLYFSDKIDIDDLIGYGTFGLIDAVEKFDPFMNIKFNTYAYPKIWGAIIRELREIDWVPKRLRIKEKKLKYVMSKLRNQLNRKPKLIEIAKEMGMDIDDYYKLEYQLQGVGNILSIYYSFSDNADSTSLIDLLEGPEKLNPGVIMEDKMIKEYIHQSLKKLDERERKVIELYYFDGVTLKQIGKLLNITEGRASQLCSRAKENLRNLLKKYKLENIFLSA